MTVETEANGDLRSLLKEVIPWLVCSAHFAGISDYCPALAACNKSLPLLARGGWGGVSQLQR